MLGEDAWISFVVRDHRLLPVRGESQLRAGDEVLVIADPDQQDTITALFTGSARGLPSGRAARGRRRVRAARRRGATPSSVCTVAAPRTPESSHTASAACRSATVPAVNAVGQPGLGGAGEQPRRRRPGEDAGLQRRGVQHAAGGPHDGRGRPLQQLPLQRGEDDVVGAEAVRVPLRGHVDRVGQRLRAAEQPRRLRPGSRPGTPRPRVTTESPSARWRSTSAGTGDEQRERRSAAGPRRARG